MKEYLISFLLISIVPLNKTVGRFIPTGVRVKLNNPYETELIEKAIISFIKEVFPEIKKYNNDIDINYSVIIDNSIINTGKFKIDCELI